MIVGQVVDVESIHGVSFLFNRCLANLEELAHSNVALALQRHF